MGPGHVGFTVDPNTGSGRSGAIAIGAAAWLPQLAEDAAYRTDISLTNTGTLPATVTVTLFDGAGDSLWKWPPDLPCRLPEGWPDRAATRRRPLRRALTSARASLHSARVKRSIQVLAARGSKNGRA